MVECEDPGEAAPEDSRDEAVDRLGRKTTNDTRSHDANQHQREVVGVDFHHPAILQPVTRVSAPVDLLDVEQPTNVPVPQTFHAAPDTCALWLRRMGIAIGI